MTVAENVSRNVRRLRISRGWTQEEAGERFGAIYGEPWSKAVWSAAEQTRGVRQRSWAANELAALADLFGVSIPELLVDDEPEGAPDGGPAAGNFSAWMRTERTRAGMSQARLTEALTEAGLSWHQTTVAKTEARTRPLLLDEAIAICRVFGATPDVALGLREDDEDRHAVSRQRQFLRTLRDQITNELMGGEDS